MVALSAVCLLASVSAEVANLSPPKPHIVVLLADVSILYVSWPPIGRARSRFPTRLSMHSSTDHLAAEPRVGERRLASTAQPPCPGDTHSASGCSRSGRNKTRQVLFSFYSVRTYMCISQALHIQVLFAVSLVVPEWQAPLSRQRLQRRPHDVPRPGERPLRHSLLSLSLRQRTNCCGTGRPRQHDHDF
jgi:hypothetical protein